MVVPVDDGEVPRIYKFKDGVWKFWNFDEDGKGFWSTEGTTIPAGTGFWYKSAGDGTINW